MVPGLINIKIGVNDESQIHCIFFPYNKQTCDSATKLVAKWFILHLSSTESAKGVCTK